MPLASVWSPHHVRCLKACCNGAGFAGLALDVEAAGARPARPRGLRLRDALLSTVAAGALSLAIGGPALAGPDACTLSVGGTVATCTRQPIRRDQLYGLSVTTLNVNNLTQAITPAGGTDGINLINTFAITITSDTGAFGITTAGNFAYGISARSITLATTVTSTGNISTAGNFAIGILASGGGAVTVTSTGNISTAGSNAFGIFAENLGAGAVTVTSTGNITTAGGTGIFAYSGGGGAVHGDLDRQHLHGGRHRDLCLQRWRQRRHGDLDRQHHHSGR